MVGFIVPRDLWWLVMHHPCHKSIFRLSILRRFIYFRGVGGLFSASLVQGWYPLTSA